MTIELIGLVLSSVTILLSIVVIAYASQQSKINVGQREDIVLPQDVVEKIRIIAKRKVSAEQEKHLKKRIVEANRALQQRMKEKQVNQLVSNLLIVGQYIVGGTLATSFVQETFSKQLIGGLGLVVLVTTILHQRYRPDIKADVAEKKINALRALVRKTEDDMVARSSVKVSELIATLTQGLNQIESGEDFEVDSTKQTTTDD